MTATETDRLLPPAHPLLGGCDGLHVEREYITFTTPAPGRLAVQVAVRNAGPNPTGPTFAVLQSAPLGAFVPWRPLDVVRVPALAPGEETTLTGEYRYDPPRALGGADRIPPERLLVALGLGEPDRPRRDQSRRPAADPMALLGLGGAYWAGNLNIFFPGKDVERHVAHALRIYPGRVNLAMFVVGTGTADQYKFTFTGDGTAWKPRILDTMAGIAIVHGAKTSPLKEGKWHRPGTGVFMLAVEPPAKAETGSVNVHVCQKSTGREAVVEFTMDARAAGPGCYKL